MVVYIVVMYNIVVCIIVLNLIVLNPEKITNSRLCYITTSVNGTRYILILIHVLVKFNFSSPLLAVNRACVINAITSSIFSPTVIINMLKLFNDNDPLYLLRMETTFKPSDIVSGDTIM